MLTDENKVMELTESDLNNLVTKALVKLQVKTENDLCRYLPGPKGGHIHHFTLKKYKQKAPSEFAALVQEFVLNVDKPVKFDPKSRARRGPRKRKEMSFTRIEMEKIIELANKAGDSELLSKFLPKKPLPLIKRELARSIRHEEIREDLWQCYVDAVKLQRAKEALK